jgi:selenium metabolism protein YedF
MEIIDTSGQLCPAPLISTKRALKNATTGDSFRIITDNRTSFSNISRFLKDNRTDFTSEESNGTWTLTITKKISDNNITDPAEYCTADIPHFAKDNFIIAFSSDKMGDGDDELGQLLIANFIKAIKDLDRLPEKMIFYNRGVLLGTEESQVSGYLKELETMGIILLFCATCVKYYSLEEKIKTGTLSNMFEIVQVMASASNVIKP